MNFKKNDVSISIFALCDVYYDSYYILGLREFFQTNRIKFTFNGFPNFEQGTFAAIVKIGDKNHKIIIDSRDASTILNDQLEWCEVYGKVNYFKNSIQSLYASRVRPIGPSFGIKIWNLPETLYFAGIHFLRFQTNIKDKRNFLANYWRQYKRLPITEYDNAVSERNYIFFMGTIWKNEIQTNLYRSNFIQACKRINGIKFEGGFAPRKDGQNLTFEKLITNNRYPFTEYLARIKRSALAFNTPAVLSCHGWKLGEFLAMGKAIISTEHQNELPAPLIANFHVEYVSPKIEEIENKLKVMLNDNNHRLFLEKNAKNYFATHLTPIKVIENLYLSIE